MKAPPFRCGMIAAILGFLGTCLWGGWVISQSTSSTAAVGFVFLPFRALQIAVPFFLFGYCTHLAVAALCPPRRFLRGILCAAVALALLVPFAYWMGNGLILCGMVRDIRTMTPPQIEHFLQSSPFRENKYALNAILERKDLDAATLYKIAQIPSPELHERLGSAFPVMGKNTKGLAVMRLVARHPHVDSRTLALLANSPDDYVLGDVAANDKTPPEILPRLVKKGGYLIEWGLTHNPNTPPEVLHTLSLSGNKYTRAGVAGNSSTSQEDLERLAQDPEATVRGSVMQNPQCRPALRLRNTFNERVQRHSQ